MELYENTTCCLNNKLLFIGQLKSNEDLTVGATMFVKCIPKLTIDYYWTDCYSVHL